MKTCGIYQIVCTANNAIYIGQSTGIELRWIRHKHHLRKGIHCNRFMQAVWNKHGEEAFQHTILEECGADQLTEREQLHLDSVLAQGLMLMNLLTVCVDSPKGTKASEETRRKMSEAHSRRPRKPHSPETIQKIREAKRGTKASVETRLKISEAGKGRKQSEETKAKRSAALKGRKHNES